MEKKRLWICRHRKWKSTLTRCCLNGLLFTLGFFGLVHTAAGAITPVLGPENFVRPPGRDVEIKREFTVESPSAVPYRLRIDNGAAGQFPRVSGAIVTLNDAVVVRSLDLTAQVAVFEKNVALKRSNKIKVQLSGAVGSGIRLSIAGIELTVDIAAPLDGLVTRDPAVAVSGTFTGSASSIVVNGVTATVGQGTFSATGVPLANGNNRLVATAAGVDGSSAADSVLVRRDLEPPLVVIETPRDGERRIETAVTIAGTVNDIIPGATVDSDDVTVTVNGRPAAVSNRTFTLPDLPLALGSNAITATAVDRAGNTRTTTIHLTREPDLAGLRITVAGGNNQQGRIGSALPEPLAVVLTTQSGTPLAGRPLRFEVSKGDGLLGAAAEHLRQVTVLSDAAGRAEVPFTLGSRTGSGFHRVRVTTPGSLTFAELCATAEPGEAQMLAITLATPVHGAAGQRMPDPLSVIATDVGGNPVPGVLVTFRVERGGGSFTGAESLTVATNADGISLAPWTLGPSAGVANNEVSATFPGNPGLPARFVVSGLAVVPGGDTRLRGFVQNSVGQPIVGATAQISGTALQTLTGPDGRFQLSGVPSGEQRIAILGATADDPANGVHYPRIELAVQLVPGADNEMDRIVILPFLDMEGSQMVGGDEDVVLGMAGVPGFGIKVFAHSTIRPDGTRGPVRMSSSQVKFDKVPMPPPRGSTAFVVGTLQPGGILFDPPAQVTYPNVEGLAPGDVADVFAFHHEVGQFVNVGPGTVSADGSVVTSDPGFGLVESGWHCLFRIPGPTANCANGCNSSWTWQITANGTGSGTNQPVIAVADPDPSKRQEADVTVRFTPPGGAVDAAPTWTIQNSSVAQIVGTPTNGTTVKIRALAGGRTTLTSPIYRIPLPPAQGGDKTCQAQIDVLTVGLKFAQDSAQKYGYDEYTNRTATPVVPYKSVEVGKSDTAKLEIVPATSAAEAYLVSSAPGSVTVSPARATASPQTVSVGGVAKAESDVEGRVGSSSGPVGASMRTAAYTKKTKTVALILVHEENDDVQVIPVGKGKPGTVAITAGTNGVLNTTPAGDDQIVGATITTGANGVCNTTKAGDDVQVIASGKGKPNEVCTTRGANNFRDTIPAGDDAAVGDDVNAGADGICNTIAKSTPVLSTDAGTAADVQAYLNTTIYNQAVVSWTVTKLAAKTINFDLDRDGKINVSTAFLGNDEMRAVRDGARAAGYDYNVFLVDNPDDGSFGFADFNQPFVFVHGGTHTGTGQSTSNTIAHELGHAQGLVHPDQNGDPDPANLMHSVNTNPERLRKGQWDLINP